MDPSRDLATLAWMPTLFPALDQRRPTADHNSKKNSSTPPPPLFHPATLNHCFLKDLLFLQLESFLSKRTPPFQKDSPPFPTSFPSALPFKCPAFQVPFLSKCPSSSSALPFKCPASQVPCLFKCPTFQVPCLPECPAFPHCPAVLVPFLPYCPFPAVSSTL